MHILSSVKMVVIIAIVYCSKKQHMDPPPQKNKQTKTNSSIGVHSHQDLMHKQDVQKIDQLAIG